MYRKNRIICRNFERVELFLGSFAFSWEQRKLLDIAVKVTEKNIGRQYVETFTNSAEFGIISQRDFFDHDISKMASLDGYYIVRDEDFVYNPRISASAPVGPINRNKLGRTGVMSPLYTVFRPHDVDTTYLEHFFKSNYWHAFMNFNGDSGARSDRFSIKDNVFFEMPIPIPPIEEQKKIGEYLTGLDNLITLHQRKVHINTKRPMRLSENERSIKTISWEQRKLGEVSESYSGGTPSVCVKEYYGGQIPFIRSAEINSEITELFLTEEGLKNSSARLVAVGDILYALYGATSGEVGRARLRGAINQAILAIKPHTDYDSEYLAQWLRKSKHSIIETYLQGGQGNLSGTIVKELSVDFPSLKEQQAIGDFFSHLDHLITLHQRKSPSRKNWRCVMIKETRGIDLFHEYYAKWITVYKKGAIRKVTMDKYLMTQKWLEKLIPDLRICDMNRIAYQQLLNDYAEHHERQTTMDFHHQLKGAILDAVDEGLIDRDPTRKAIIKGRTPMSKKVKYLNQFELHTLLTSLELKNEVNWDYFILLVAKTGMRFSEALALTPKDFDFSHQTLSINKTWDYKGKGGFQPTKNKSSIRKIQIDWQTVIQFSELVKGFPKDQPIFVKSNVYNSTVNDILGRYCERSNIPVISIHGLRHTHASLLLFAGVSIASVARRLGHSSMTTTQKTYLHIIQELENKDIDLVMRSLSGLS